MDIKGTLKKHRTTLIVTGATALVLTSALVLTNVRLNQYKLLLGITGEIIEDMGGNTSELIAAKYLAAFQK